MAVSTESRWLEHEKAAQAVESLIAEVAEACDRSSPAEHGPRYSDRQLAHLNTRSMCFLAAVAVFIVAVICIPNLLPGELLAKNNNMARVVQWIMIIVPIGFGVAAKNRLRRALQRTAVHDSSVEKLTSQFPGLRDARLSPVRGPSVNVLPRLATDCKANTRCSLFGEYREHALAMFEVEYTAPLSLDVKKAIERTQASLVSDPDTEQFSRMRTAEAIVFFRPLLELPDLFIAGKAEPLCSYQSRWVKEAGGSPWESRVKTFSSFEAFSSCPISAVEAFSLELAELLSLRPNSLVQVIGGFVVVVPRSWGSATPMNTAVAAFEVQLDLDFACAVYDALGGQENGQGHAEFE